MFLDVDERGAIKGAGPVYVASRPGSRCSRVTRLIGKRCSQTMKGKAAGAGKNDFAGLLGCLHRQIRKSQAALHRDELKT